MKNEIKKIMFFILSKKYQNLNKSQNAPQTHIAEVGIQT